MDNQILRDLFEGVARASEVLGVDAAFRTQVRATKDRLPPMRVGSRGNIQEWLADWVETELNHRHVSHLYGLHPSNQITKRDTPQLYKAARRTLELRGDDGTGWSLAWKINYWARLEDGARARKLLGDLVRTDRLAPEHVRPASAVPDRRQLRRDLRHRRDAAAEPQRRAAPAAGAAVRLARRAGRRACGDAADTRCAWRGPRQGGRVPDRCRPRRRGETPRSAVRRRASPRRHHRRQHTRGDPAGVRRRPAHRARRAHVPGGAARRDSVAQLVRLALGLGVGVCLGLASASASASVSPSASPSTSSNPGTGRGRCTR